MNSVNNQTSSSHRNFLRGNITDKVQNIRPPWSVAESLFLEKCNQCNDCLDACHEKIITHDADGYPCLNFSQTGCTFCAECLETCKTGALRGLRSDIEQAWNHSIRISDSCLSVAGVVCRSCGDHCDESAIKFTLLRLGRALPEINSRSCTGCGQCIAFCPANAISIHEAIERSL